MSDMYDENDALTEAYWNDPVGVISAAVNQAVVQNAQQIAAMNAQAEAAKVFNEAQAELSAKLGDTWDTYGEQARKYAAHHNIIEFGTKDELVEKLGTVAQQLVQNKKDAEKAAIEAENEKWRQQIRDANAPGFHL